MAGQPVQPTELATVLGVLGVLLGTIAWNNVGAARAARRSRAAVSPGIGWVGRHVTFAGHVVGEVVAEEGDRLLLCQGEETLAVPRAQVRREGLDLGLSPPFDRDAAAAEGAAWEARRGAAP